MIDKNSYIGIFDSGSGGLTVTKQIIERLPNENILFFGDTAHLPYGTKSDRQIKEYATNAVAFLNGFPLKCLVIACNTADSVARSTLVNEFNMPIYGVVHPTSHAAIKATVNGKIGVIATSATVRSNAYKNAIHAIDDHVEVYQQACPLLVPLVENRHYQKDDLVVRMVLQEYIDPLIEQGIDTLVLGCTHYPLLYDAIHDLYPQQNIISSSHAAADDLVDSLIQRNLVNDQPDHIYRYYCNDDAEAFLQNAKIFIGEDKIDKITQVSV